MGRFFKKTKKQKEEALKRKIERKAKYSPEQMIKLAEDHLNTKVNELADFLEAKNWSNQDTWTVFNIIIKNDLEPKFGARQKKKLRETMEILTITKEK